MIKSTDTEMQSLGVEMFYSGGGKFSQAHILNPEITKGEWRWIILNRRMHDIEDLSICAVKTHAAIYRLKGRSWKRRRYGI